jgi:hypothetical protein
MTACLSIAIGAAACVAACGPSRSGGSTASAASSSVPVNAKPTARLFILSNPAGALEPCGCSKDQLGGAKHLAAYVASQKEGAEGSILVGAGPLFFMDPSLDKDRGTQDTWKGEALADAMAAMGLAAWAPAQNDWAAGKDQLAKLRASAKGAFLAANLTGDAGLAPSKIVEVGGLKIGIIGLSDPTGGGSAKLPDGVSATPPVEALKREVAALKQGGARALVCLAALPRGEALRLLDEVKDLSVLVLGKPVDRGDGNDKQKAATMVDKTLVVDMANHLQTVAVVDLFLREPSGSSGLVTFADAGGVSRSEELVSVSERIRDLEARINGWEKDKSVDPKDVAARKKDLEDLRAQKTKLEIEGAPPPGSFFRYASVEVREKLGEDKVVSEAALGFYKRVNEHNKVAFKDRVPEAPEKGQPGYVGVEACSSCHKDERAVWDKTQHAQAYATLQKQFVEYNLECVGCHVTGYDKPGGSTVTHVEKLENVGCEVCHGPGSLHVKEPEKKGLIQAKPDLKRCTSECHHPPHVDGFDPTVKVQGILGPGHGM